MNNPLKSAVDDKKTSTRIISAAEELFSQRGFDAVSLRDITNLAGVNVASVSYYFGGKDSLIEAVLLRHVQPITEQRERNIAALRDKYKQQTIPLRAILEAFTRPFAEHIKQQTDQAAFTRFTGRVMSEGASKLPGPVLELYRRTVEVYMVEICRSMPSLSQKDALWHLHFCFGTLTNTFLNGETLQRLFGEKVGSPAIDELLNWVIDYAEGGFLRSAEIRSSSAES